ncbi:oligopeptide/dipeptide ABC transporter, ATP-binding protein, C-terminal domain-containing protein [Sporobacter termitidis DSM 10068]|uniref:Nickel import system ATP-binding protein NikD n=1 Tax=Sporobacter termitidis DSM 10068 TaxID=1123282 RepID=A0A1M5WLZ1_9FIRM|nr:ABC transporter ATP-binding protein [Sporobacter termitidis]SHH88620.1 oligopeptide/dipeptide ABC transporter, ATP-binding protein, C-terminal domain-containing protein [Sporobacter termitidis DSM 10068]
MLEINHVSVEFASENRVLAVDDISIRLPDGSRTAIVGETGSGKSVLLLSIVRLLPRNAIVRGKIELDGENLLSADKKRLQQVRGGVVSYVPQGGGASMNPLLKVGYQVGEPLIEHKNYSRSQAVEASISLMKRFNLLNEEKLARSYPHTFSGGMRQRAMVAMGIAAGPRIILADEPTKGLDDKRVRLVADSINMLKEETLLCVTHDMSFAQAVSRDICVMYAAQQVEFGKSEEILNDALHPYTRDIINAMPENGMRYDDVGFAPAHGSYLNHSDGCRYRDRCRERSEKCVIMPPVFDVNGRKVRCWKYDSAN